MDLKKEYQQLVGNKGLFPDFNLRVIQDRMGRDVPVGLTVDMPQSQGEAITELCDQLRWCIMALEEHQIIKNGRYQP